LKKASGTRERAVRYASRYALAFGTPKGSTKSPKTITDTTEQYNTLATHAKRLEKGYTGQYLHAVRLDILLHAKRL